MGSILSSSVGDEVSVVDKFLGNEALRILCRRLQEREGEGEGTGGGAGAGAEAGAGAGPSSSHSHRGEKKKKLTLRGNNIGAEGAAHLAGMLRECHSIEALSLEWNQIGSHGAASLAEALECNRGLVHLDLRNNSIDNDGAAALASSISANKTLKTLDLRWNQIDDQGALSFKSVLTERVPRLRIMLGGNTVSESMSRHMEEWSQLQTANPFGHSAADMNMSSSSIREPSSDTTGTGANSSIVQTSYHNTSELNNHNNSAQAAILERELSDLRRQCMSLQAAFADSQRQLDSSSVRMVELEQKVAREEYRSAHISEALKHANVRMSVQAEENESQRSSFEAERQELSTAMGGLHKEHDQQLRRLRAEGHSLSERNQRLEQDLTNLRDEHERAADTHKSHRDADMLKLRTTMADLSKYKISDAKLSSDNATLRALNTRLTEKENYLENELRGNRLEFETVLAAASKKHVQDLESERADHSQAVSGLVEKRNLQVWQVTELRSELSQVRSQLVSEAVSSEQKLLEAVKQARQEESERHDQVTKDMMKRLELLSEGNSDLAARCQGYVQELSKLREQHQSGLNTLEKHMHSNREEIGRQAEKLQGLSTQVVQLEDCKRRLQRELDEAQVGLRAKESEAAQWHEELKLCLAAKQALEQQTAALRESLGELRAVRAREFQLITRKVTEAYEKEIESLRIDLKIVD